MPSILSTLERGRIRRMEARDAEVVLAWRNHADVRRYMLTRHEISSEEHYAWFQRANADTSRSLLIVEDGSGPIGFVHFSDVGEGSVSKWGFYTTPGAAAGSGTRIGATALDFAFQQLKVHKVCGQALDFNERSVRLHQKLGFTREGVLRSQHQSGDGYYHDLICFGLLHQEWT